KIEGGEKSFLEQANVAFHRNEYQRFGSELQEASESSQLPEIPSCKANLNDLLVRVRMTFI
ncbi:MAG: nucleotidyltransferase, partial [Coleofasciculus sp. S288]|nr:nucleotidyltransferase [Coleofasciculus sp. S288]